MKFKMYCQEIPKNFTKHEDEIDNDIMTDAI